MNLVPLPRPSSFVCPEPVLAKPRLPKRPKRSRCRRFITKRMLFCVCGVFVAQVDASYPRERPRPALPPGPKRRRVHPLRLRTMVSNPAKARLYIMVYYDTFNAYTLMHLCERACLGKILLASLCLPRVWLGKRSVSHIRQSELFFLKQGGSQQR
eukprot:COSAG06_NODE_1772_length_8428_cov_8.827710_3_plen_155_part_00